MIKKVGFIDCSKCHFGYEWKTFFTEADEIPSYRYDDVLKNVVKKSKINGQYFITTSCPKCGKREYVSITR